VAARLEEIAHDEDHDEDRADEDHHARQDLGPQRALSEEEVIR
jgi:hypothetical protein